MKKRMVMALLIGTMSMALPVSCLAEAADTAVETEAAADETEEVKEEDFRAIGEKTEEALGIFFENTSGKKIKAFSLKVTGEQDYSENLLEEKAEEAEAAEENTEETKEPEVIEDKEKVVLYYTEKKEETEETPAAEDTEKKEAEEQKKYDLKLTFEDDTTAELHEVVIEDLEKGFKIECKENIYYITGKSISEKKEVDTYEAEKAIAETAAASVVAETEPAYEESYDYNEDYDYDYDDDYYDDGDDYYDDGDDDYYDDGDDDGGDDDGGDGCLDDGLMN